jgi:CMP-N,N'-diacetyllegionaminic acid synthase
LKEKRLEILGLIPARGGSRGIPGKNLRLLGGRSLVARAVESGLESRLVSRLILSTDSGPIAEEGRRAGAEVPFLRPAELAKDETPTALVVAHALKWLEENEGTRPDILVLLQPTAPLRQARHIDEALSLLVSEGARSVVSVTPVPGHYHPSWQFSIRDGALFPFMETGKVPPRRQDLPQTYTRNGAIYAAWTETWLTGTMAYGSGCVPYLMMPEESVNIDSPEDLELAEFLLARGRAGR